MHIPKLWYSVCPCHVSTGKAANNINATKLHCSFHVSIRSRYIVFYYRKPSNEVAHFLRMKQKYLKLLLMCQISLVGADTRNPCCQWKIVIDHLKEYLLLQVKHVFNYHLLSNSRFFQWQERFFWCAVTQFMVNFI